MQKKVLSSVLTLLMCLSMLPAMALVADAKPLDISQLTVKDDLSYEYASAHNAYIRVTNGKKYGLLDRNGNEVIPLIYDSLTFVADDLVAVGQDVKAGEKNTGVGKCGLMDMAGNWVVSPKYDRIDPFYEDMAAVYVNNNMGFIDKTGKEVIPLRYPAAVSNNVEVWPDDVFGRLGIIWAFRSGFSDGVACVRKGGVTSVIDKQGKVLFETDLLINGFSDGRAKAVQVPPDDGPQDNMVITTMSLKYGYMDKTGKMVIPAIYDDAYDFSEGYAVVGKQNSNGETLYGAIDRAGNVVVPLIYHGMTPFHEGMARVYEQDEEEPGHWYKYGFVNTKGELVVPMIYQEASNFSDGMAVVAVKDERFKEEEEEDHHQCLFGCIDKQGNVVIPLEYCASFTFYDGVAYVCKGYPYALFDYSRHPKEKFGEFCERMREQGSPQECSLIDTEGKTLISFGDRGEKDYTNWVNFSGNVAVYRKSDGKYAIIKNPLNEGQPKPTFTDVPAGNWAFDPVAWAVENGVTNGYGAKDKFAPAVECTEAQILTFLYRANRGGGTPVAEDMNEAVSWAREKGMIDESFKQNTPCTRAQAVKFIWEAFGKQTATKPASFTDVDKSADYAEAVSWAVEKKVTKGYGGNDTFAPDRVCNRGEIVTFLHRAYNN